MDRFQYLLLMGACVAITLPLELRLGARVWRQPRRLLVALQRDEEGGAIMTHGCTPPRSHDIVRWAPLLAAALAVRVRPFVRPPRAAAVDAPGLVRPALL